MLKLFEIDIYDSSYSLYVSFLKYRHVVNWSFFYLWKEGLLQHTVDNEVSALARLIFYENLLIG